MIAAPEHVVRLPTLVMSLTERLEFEAYREPTTLSEGLVGEGLGVGKVGFEAMGAYHRMLGDLICCWSMTHSFDHETECELDDILIPMREDLVRQVGELVTGTVSDYMRKVAEHRRHRGEKPTLTEDYQL